MELPHVLPNPLIFFTSANTLTRSDVFLHVAGVCQILFLVLCIPLKGAAPTDTLRHISPANIPEFIDATTQVHLMARANIGDSCPGSDCFWCEHPQGTNVDKKRRREDSGALTTVGCLLLERFPSLCEWQLDLDID